MEWRSTFGDTVAVGTKADGNSNGAIDAADYTVWRDAASTGSGAGSPVTAIPEPRSTELALLAAAVLIVFVRITPL